MPPMEDQQILKNRVRELRTARTLRQADGGIARTGRGNLRSHSLEFAGSRCSSLRSRHRRGMGGYAEIPQRCCECLVRSVSVSFN